MPSILDHLHNGGCIRVHHATKKITLVCRSIEVTDVRCTYGDVQDLINNNLVEVETDAAEMVLRRADTSITVTQRDREVFQCILEHWNNSDGGIWAAMSYKDLFDLCDKFSVPRPPRILEFLKWAEEQKRIREHGGAT